MEAASKFEVKMGSIGLAGVRSGREPDGRAEIEFNADGAVTSSDGTAVVIYVTEPFILDNGGTVGAGQVMRPRPEKAATLKSEDPTLVERLRTEFERLRNDPVMKPGPPIEANP